MATTFTESKATLDSIAQRSEQNRKRLDQAKLLITQALNDLTAMGTSYSAWITDFDAAATANTGNAAWDAADAEKTQLTADFQALKTRAQTMDTAITSL